MLEPRLAHSASKPSWKVTHSLYMVPHSFGLFESFVSHFTRYWSSSLLFSTFGAACASTSRVPSAGGSGPMSISFWLAAGVNETSEARGDIARSHNIQTSQDRGHYKDFCSPASRQRVTAVSVTVPSTASGMRHLHDLTDDVYVCGCRAGTGTCTAPSRPVALHQAYCGYHLGYQRSSRHLNEAFSDNRYDHAKVCCQNPAKSARTAFGEEETPSDLQPPSLNLHLAISSVYPLWMSRPNLNTIA